MSQFARYVVAGVVNTALGYGVFWAMLRLLKLNPEAANALGYAFGLLAAFLLNRFFVFAVEIPPTTAGIRFLAAFALAFSVNQGVLFALFRLFSVPAEVAQVFAMGAYTVVFYLLNKRVVFVANG